LHAENEPMSTQVKHREIWRIAYPIILGSIVQNVISVTDTAFLGHVGEVELGAAALGGVFYLTLIMLALGFSIGTQIIVARRFGERQWNAIGTTVEHTLGFLLLLAGVVFLLMRLFGAPLF
jgi:Na+-driven multidrug efflux pump